MDGRLARVHLRGGLLTLARASLEQMAGVGALDREALADLAEARWRSGDLEGAAEAAVAHPRPAARADGAPDRGRGPPRHREQADARRHRGEVARGSAEAWTGCSRGSRAAPRGRLELPDWMDGARADPAAGACSPGAARSRDPEPGTWRLVPPPGSDRRSPGRAALAAAMPPRRPADPATLDQAAAALGRAAGEELEVAEQELAMGLIPDAVDRLALVLRFDPALAPVILSMADRALMAPGDRQQGLVALHLLRGDAYRGLGREMEAADAYQEAMRALSARATVKESQ